ncbi:hypothetical protein M513_04529 [Trichuris suis]|uniref:Uncharacterized protein n=1 Tax=Trichuris suis TaxID=68888 RepID=A0A085MBI8_9BILA|nr:hypothetical protein M513_04529 [Trichuris suis]
MDKLRTSYLSGMNRLPLGRKINDMMEILSRRNEPGKESRFYREGNVAELLARKHCPEKNAKLPITNAVRYVELYQGIIKPFEQGNKVQQVVNKSVCHFLRVALSATIIAKLALSSEFVSEVRLFKRSSIPTACLIYSLDDNFELPVCKGVDELVGHLPSEL